MREALALVRDVSSVDDFAPEELLSRRDAATRSAA
jgi:hypothetical protein